MSTIHPSQPVKHQVRHHEVRVPTKAPAALFAVWRRPWRLLTGMNRRGRVLLGQLGAVLAAMNVLFYLAVARLPLAIVGAIEFLGVVLLASAGARTPRNAAALALTIGGVAALADLRLAERR